MFNARKIIGTVDIFDNIITVVNELGIPLVNFISWKEFSNWLNCNNYVFNTVGNIVVKYFN